MKSESLKLIFAAFLLIGFLQGCAHLEQYEEEDFITELPEPDPIGIYHKVGRGQTIWRIAKTYNVTINDIVQSNKIPNVAKIEENQLIFIPGAYSVKDIILEEEKETDEFIWPIQGKVIKYFHDRRNQKPYKGIDIKARSGEAVKAARSGEVVFADYLTGYGQTVILNHFDGLYSIYANNARLLVKSGDRVKRRKEIALVGTKNNLAYLHFQIRKNSIEDNPLYYLP